MCILAFTLTNRSKKAIVVLIKPPKKKWCNPGKRSAVMLLVTNVENNAICNTSGILLCDISESIILSTFPKVLNK